MSDCGTGHFIEFDDPLLLKWRSGLPQAKRKYCIGRRDNCGEDDATYLLIVTPDAVRFKPDVARSPVD